jgi:putative membrane protein
MKLSIALATTCVLLSAPAFAQSATTPYATGATQASPTISTPDFTNKAIESNMFDVRAAQIAEQKGAHENYAQRDVRDHTKMADDFKMMAGKVNAKIPSALDNDRQAKLDELGKLWGKSFDDAYNRDQRESFQNEIGLFKQYPQNGDNPALKQWAAKMLPALESYLIDVQRQS